MGPISIKNVPPGRSLTLVSQRKKPNLSHCLNNCTRWSGRRLRPFAC